MGIFRAKNPGYAALRLSGWERAMGTVARADISFERFLADPEIGDHAEWVDGIVVPMHAVDDRHDEVVRWLGDLIGPYVRREGLGRLLGEPFLMKLPEAHDLSEPLRRFEGVSPSRYRAAGRR